MPIVVVLLLVAFFGTALGLLAVPVSTQRLAGFLARHSLELADVGRARLRANLAARRRARVVGVLVAAGIGVWYSVPDNGVEFNFVLMLGGWLAGAIVAECLQRSVPAGVAQPVRTPHWMKPLPRRRPLTRCGA